MTSRGLLITSLVFVAGGALLVIDGQVARGVAGVVFFGSCAVLGAWRLRRSKRAAWSTAPLLAPQDGDGGWFATDFELAPTDAEAAFLAKLTHRAATWPTAGTHSYALRDDGGSDLLLSVTLLSADGVPILPFGVLLRGDRVRGDKRFWHFFDLEDPSTSLAMTATGPLDELVEHAGRWFETILRRPVERLEWWHDGTPYAVRYQFADTAEGLTEAYDSNAAPPGQYARLIAAGSFRGSGWIRTAGIGTPDRAVTIRAGGTAVPTPRLPRLRFYECPLEPP